MAKRRSITTVLNVIVKEGGKEKHVFGIDWRFPALSEEHALASRLRGSDLRKIVMIDQNTVVIEGPEGTNAKSVYSVLRHSSQCGKCGAMPGTKNEWCSECQAGSVGNGFDPKKKLAEVIALIPGVDVDDEEEG